MIKKMDKTSQFLDQIKKIDKKVKLNEEFPEWNKSVQFLVQNGTPFYFVVKDGKVSKFGEGKINNPDVTIQGDLNFIERLFEGELSIIGGHITKKLIINGRIGDAIGANVLIQAARVF